MLRPILLAALVLACACDIPDEASGCAVETATGAEPARTARLGTSDSGFTPYADDAPVALVRGQQGGLMVTPRVGVPATTLDPDTLCATVLLADRLDDAVTPTEPASGVVLLRRKGDFYESPKLQNFLGYSKATFVGHSLTLNVEVVTAAFVASGSATIRLE